MQVQIKTAILGAALLGLSGCQSFPVVGKWFKPRPATTQSEGQLADRGPSALEDGRSELRSGNIAAAIASFQIALGNRTTRADAANGLAVAWAMLGRNDLAEQYFLAALREQPDNERFAANLMRLQSAQALARSKAQDMLAQAAVPAAPPARSAPPVETVQTAFGHLSGSAVRISPHEVLIRSTPVMAGAPRMTVQYGAGDRAIPVERMPAPDSPAAAVPAGRSVPAPQGS